MSDNYRSILNVLSPSFINEYSMSFDGMGEWFNCGTDASLAVTNITISAWIKTSGSSGSDVIISADSLNSTLRRYQLLVDNTSGCISFFYWNPSNVLKSIQGTTIVNDGNWHHVMVVNDGANLKLYIDGALDNSNTNGDTIRTSGTTITAIGSAYGSYSFFLGNIDEVAIWNNDQSSNISTIYNGGTPNDLTSLSPLSWWRMGDGDTWDGSSWILTDNGSGGNDASSNTTMPEGARVTDIP